MDFHDVYAYTQNLVVLFVEDEPAVREATASLLENYFERVDTAEHGKEGLECYSEALSRNERYDMVITDINMPHLGGIEMADKIRQLHSDQSIIFASAHSEQNFLLDAIKLGINHYLIKPVSLEDLSKVLFKSAQAIVNQKKVDEQGSLALNSQEQSSAYYDQITGLPCRELFLDRMTQSLKRTQRYKTKLALLLVKINSFERINDADKEKVIQLFGKCFEQKMREGDTLAYLEAGVFAVIAEDIEALETVDDVVEKSFMCTDENNFDMHLSIGISLYEGGDIRVDELLKFADKAAVKAKKDACNSYAFYTQED